MFFSNAASDTLTMPAYGMAIGTMHEMETAYGGISYLGLDTLTAVGGETVKNWGSSLPGFFGVRSSFLSCNRQDTGLMPPSVSHRLEVPVSVGSSKE